MAPEDLQTREKILHTAFALFRERGYERTPIQAIIDAVGIAKGTFYHHFSSKEEMLVTLVESLSQHVVDAVAPVAADPSLGAVQKMLAISQVAAAQKAEDFTPAVVVLIRQMRSPANRQLTDAIDRISRQCILPFYRGVIAEGVAQGVFAVRDPAVAAELVLGTILTMKDRITDLFLEAFEGRSGAAAELVSLYRSIEEAVERQLGAAAGSLPLYTSVDIEALLGRLSSGGRS